MDPITIKNNTDKGLVAYDSYEDKDATGNFYGTLKELARIGAASGAQFASLHSAVNTIVLFDEEQKPVARFVSVFGKNDFAVTDDNLTAMAQALKLVEAIAADPKSPLAEIKTKKGVKEMDAFFQKQPGYERVTADLYMMALLYKAAHPDTVKSPPEERTYSLSTLVSYLSSAPYPAGMPDITLSHVFYHEENGVLSVGGRVKLAGVPLKDAAIARIVAGLLPVDQDVNVRIVFDARIGLNLAGTQIEFSYGEIDVPLGKGATFRIMKPTLSLSISPLFKFAVLTVSADHPFTVFGRTFDAKLAMVLDNVEVEVGLDIQGKDTSLPAPPVMRGVHLDEFGVGMGILFEPPSYALGLTGKFHVGDGPNVVAIDDDTFALVMGFVGDVPNPLFLSFYVPKLDLETLLAVFTNAKLDVGFPVHFEGLSFVWNENPLEPLALPDGSLSKAGYAFGGYVNVLGLRGFADVEIDMTKLTGIATMAPVDLGGILKLTGDGKGVTRKVDAKGNLIRNNQVPRSAAERDAIKNAASKTLIPPGGPEIGISTQAPPYFALGARASLLGLVNEEIDARIDPSGVSFELDYGSVLRSQMKCRLSTSGSFAGAFDFGSDVRIPLPGPLGSIHLVETIDADLGIAINNGTVEFSAGGGFDFEGIRKSFGPFRLDARIGKVADVIAAIERHIIENAERIFEDLLKDASKWAKLVLRGTIVGVEDVAAGLRTFFRKDINEAAHILHNAEVQVEAAARQLRAAYGAAARDVASALRSGYNASANVVAGALHGIGHTADEIGVALRDAYSASGQVAAQILKDLATPIQQVSRTLNGVFSLAPAAVADVLKVVGYPANEISSAFRSIGGAFESVGNALDSAARSVGHAVEGAANTVGHAVESAAKDVGDALNPSNWG